MARLVGSVSGRFEGELLGINMGPTGEFAWGASGAVSPQQIHQTSDIYAGETVSKIGIFSYWYLAPALTTDTKLHLAFQGSAGVHIFNEVGLQAGAPKIILRDSLKNTLLNFDSTIVASGATWHHVLISWNLNSGSTFAGDVHMYVDDVDAKPGVPITFVAGTDVEWGTGNLFTTIYRMGIVDSLINAPSLLHSGWYLNYNAYLDFSVVSNRRRFITASGSPAPLGVDGSAPTGSAPLFYFDDPAATVIQNRGTAGTFLAGTTLVDGTGPNP